MRGSQTVLILMNGTILLLLLLLLELCYSYFGNCIHLSSFCRSSEPVSRPHSWHSTKLGEGPLDSDSMMQISQGAMAAPWHQSYHARLGQMHVKTIFKEKIKSIKHSHSFKYHCTLKQISCYTCRMKIIPPCLKNMPFYYL